MTTAIAPYRPSPMDLVPATIADAGDGAARRFMEFFTANIRNPNTRQAYLRAAVQFFAWLEQHGLREIDRIEPLVVAAYVEQLGQQLSPPSVKQHLAGIRMLFDWLVVGQVVPVNPASSVRGPKHVVKKGKTLVLDAEQTRKLLDSIKIERKVGPPGEETLIPDVVGLRDRALIATMVYSFARVGAVVGMLVEDYYSNGKRWWLWLHEKGGKFHEVPAHHNTESYLDAYIEEAKIAGDKKGPLFRTTQGKTKKLTTQPMHRTDVFRMIRRRVKEAILPEACCHTFRATGITVYLVNGGTLEKAQQLAAHESARTTKLYDRTQDQISLDEVGRIVI